VENETNIDKAFYSSSSCLLLLQDTDIHTYIYKYDISMCSILLVLKCRSRSGKDRFTAPFAIESEKFCFFASKTYSTRKPLREQVGAKPGD